MADEVVGWGDHLAIRRGRMRVAVSLSNIVDAQIVPRFGFAGVQINFVQPVGLGKQVTCWVEARSGEMARWPTRSVSGR